MQTVNEEVVTLEHSETRKRTTLCICCQQCVDGMADDAAQSICHGSSSSSSTWT